MANVTQTIHSLTQGISQQPDEQKIPGQVTDMENALPNITQGLLKRPAGEFVGSLTGATTTGRWFHYYRDENEQYIGQIAQDGTVRMWACVEVKDPDTGATIHQAGASVNVVDATTGSGSGKYLYHTGEEDIQTLTLNDFTYLNNRTKTVEMDTTTEPDTNFKKEMYVELKSISYAKQYSLNLFSNQDVRTVTTATRIRVELIGSSNNYGTTSGYLTPHSLRDNYTTYNDLESDGSELFNPTDETAGDGRDAFAPNVGTRIFDIADKKVLTDENATGGITYNSGSPAEIGSITYNQGVNVTNEKGVSVSLESKGDNFKYQIDVKHDAGTAGNHEQNVDQLVSQGARDTSPTNLYFRISTTGQSVPFSTGSGQSQSTVYKARYTTTHDLLHGGEGWITGDYFFVWMKDGYYKVTVESHSTSVIQGNLALARPQPTPFDAKTTITAESILGDIRSAIIADGNNFNATDIQIIGNGLYIKRPDPWSSSTTYTSGQLVTSGENIYRATSTVTGGTAPTHTTGPAPINNWQFNSEAKFNGSTPVSELLNVVAGRVFDVGDLPTQCKHGMVVEVINSAAEEDNYYVMFEGHNEKDGEGVWSECAKPGRKIELKKSTMPVVLIRTADGNFRLTELDGSTYSIGGVTQPKVPKWDDAAVGDEDTNPEPSFVGKQINKLLFFRNRFAILADEFIVLSRAGDFTNFFSKSAIQFIASDPIDISSSSDTPATLYDGIEVNTGLVLFTRTQQFMLTTDSDAFTPLTAKINALSSYNFNYTTNPISMGTTIAFLDNAGQYSRFWEMTSIQREGEPQVIEQSAVVSKLFNKDLKYISNSKENSIIFFSEKGTQVLYGFRYFDQVFERKLASWFKWTFTGSIQYHCMQDDALYVVNMINGNQFLQKFSIKRETDTPFINSFNSDTSTALSVNREKEYLLHLDNLTKVSTKASSSVPTGYTAINATYFNQLDKTVLSGLPSAFNTGYNFAAYDNDVSLQIGKYAQNLVKYFNLKTKDSFNIVSSGVTQTVFNIPNHGLSQGDLVSYEPIGALPLRYGNFYFPTDYIFRVVINEVPDSTNQIKLSTNDNQLGENVGIGFSAVGNDQQVIKVRTLGGATQNNNADNKFYLDGNWTNQNFLIGYDFTMKVKLPTLYYSTKDGENFKSDSSANTIIHRIKMGFGPVGRYKAIVDSNFLPSSSNPIYEEEFEHLAVYHQATQIEDDVQQRVIPFYQKNKNATLTIESTHPTPATIHNLTWEGVYTPPYYTRV